MEMKLAENIRTFRKERGLTQEQLSEVLGVTAGAVYKWEAGLSVPDLDLIMEMADFFDTSVDVLLGYEMKDNHLEATKKRLQEYRHRKDREGLAEAEKALKKYPNSFKIVRECVAMFSGFGFESSDTEMLKRALELSERSLLLLDQSTDPDVSEQTIYGSMATTYLGLGETDKALEILKAHNAGGMFDRDIGHALAITEHADEAEPFLSKALAKITSDLIVTVTGYMNIFATRGDYVSTEAVLQWGVDVLQGLRKDGKPNFFDKVCSGFLAALAYAKLRLGKKEEARNTLIEAKKLAEFFDENPSYDETDVRFITRIEGASAHDDIGATAMDAIENVIDESQSKELASLWRSVKENNDDNE